ncbi:unnamed protein product [Linum trigynum]|uniref:Uncharacterized protein n=1 Tax=Linum trigynum TaxID=586398 RepID=A0AAV2DDU7_9ROSI
MQVGASDREPQGCYKCDIMGHVRAVLDDLELANEGEMADDIALDDNPEEDPEGDAARENLEDAAEENFEDDAALVQFVVALAYAEEGFHIAAAAVMPGGLVGGLVDYSSDDFGSYDG